MADLPSPSEHAQTFLPTTMALDYSAAPRGILTPCRDLDDVRVFTGAADGTSLRSRTRPREGRRR